MTITNVASIVVVGAGHATGEFVTCLRQEGFAGRITVIGDEAYLPYKRPPLSKAYLSGAATVESLFLKPSATYEKAQVEFLLGTRVEAIDRADKHIVLSDGRRIAYDKLAINTGGRVRRLQTLGADLAEKCRNFHYVRTIDDIDRLRPHLRRGARLLIIGGGYIGLESAAVASKTGLNVTVLESAPRVLARVTAPELSAFYERVHREAGVDIRTGVILESIEIDLQNSMVAAVNCGDGSRLPADVFIVGVGLLPNVELAQAAGLPVNNGILVDEYMRTEDPDIVAAGDCANHPSVLYGRRLRLESVPNAVDQARTAAGTLCGKLQSYSSVPWFWSDQYELKLQMAGLSQGYDQIVIRGSVENSSFAAFYLQRGAIIAVDAVNRPQEFMFGKRLVADRARIEPSRLADESLPVKMLIPAHA